MHQVHIMIFLIAVCHVFLSLLCLVLAQHRINKWTDWEFWGDDEDETIERLQPPRKYNSRAWKLTNFFAQQFTNAVDPFSYIAFRRFFLSKNNLKGNFVYKDILLESLQSDFKMVVGISSWMWFTVIFHVIAESYGFGHLYIPGICSLVMTCTAGTKMIANLSEISMGVMLLYDDEADGKIEQSDLDRIQNEDQSADRVAGLETDFWFDDPTLLMQVVRLALFEAALIIGESIFYRWQVGTKACFFDERGRWLAIFVCVVAVLLVVLLGTVTVPLYAVICTAGVHKLPEEEAMQLFDSLERKKELIAHYRELGLLKAAAKEEEKARSARRRSGTASRGEQRSEESDVDAQDSTPNRDACGVGSENMKLRPVVANHKVNSVVPISHDGTESMDLNPSTQAVMVEDY